MPRNNGKDLQWADLDMEAVKGPTLKLLKEAQAANEIARKKFRAFEDALIADARKAKALDDEHTLKFGYRFGKIAVAITEAEKGAPKKKTGAFRF